MSSPNPQNKDYSRPSYRPFIELYICHHHLPMPGLSGSPNSAVGNLLKGAVDSSGEFKDAALQVGIKLDLEAEVHLTARVRGDIIVGLY
ncbi:hypothetical protein J7T55_003713 [Diaporthe amygdali]|uniref:uncharacterized protein n=1 Tax=Phomopsis amygdali TaxID=1214568 RepID=UPI0022FE60FF|nr:uncharacterized protein J7T55_003713 [Diaporthe amygdali]KAJ0117301.1 hypothetical protein J7T55_003713 [Diaporthe amygdali]